MYLPRLCTCLYGCEQAPYNGHVSTSHPSPLFEHPNKLFRYRISIAKHQLPLREYERHDRVCLSIGVVICVSCIHPPRLKDIGSSGIALDLIHVLWARVSIIAYLGENCSTTKIQKHVRVLITCRKPDLAITLTLVNLHISDDHSGERENLRSRHRDRS